MFCIWGFHERLAVIVMPSMSIISVGTMVEFWNDTGGILQFERVIGKYCFLVLLKFTRLLSPHSEMQQRSAEREKRLSVREIVLDKALGGAEKMS